MTFFKQTQDTQRFSVCPHWIAAAIFYQRFPPTLARDTDLDGAQGLVGVVLVKVVDVSWQGDAEEVVSLPQAAQLLVTHCGTHVEGGDRRFCANVPQFYSLVTWGGDQLAVVCAPADLE